MDITNVLPVERISHMISLTAPRDACRLAVVSPVFKSAADSDLVWEKFLPSDHKLIIPNSVSSSSLVTSLSKKVLIFHLYHHPIFINNGTMEKETGRKCYVVGARGYLLSFIEKFVTSNCMQNHTIYYAFFGNTGRWNGKINLANCHCPSTELCTEGEWEKMLRGWGKRALHCIKVRPTIGLGLLYQSLGNSRYYLWDYYQYR